MTAKQIVEMFRAEGHINVRVNGNARIAINTARRTTSVKVNWDAGANEPIAALSIAADLTAAAILALEVERLLQDGES